MKNIGLHFISIIEYNLLQTLTWCMHLFPLRLHYLFSDLSFFVGYYIIKYRRRVAATNLANSFPEKTIIERDQIGKKFYHHLTDTFIESFYYNQISFDKSKKCAKYLNPELVNSYLEKGRQVVLITGHYNNWELFSNWPLYSSHRFYLIYKALTNSAFDKFFFNLRSRFGGLPLERSATIRQLMDDHNKGIPSVTSFIFDQSPRFHDIQYWNTFLNQDTPWILGAEKLARKLDTVVVFLAIKKIKRGVYEGEHLLITERAAESPKFEITEKCIRILEQQIIDKPEFWLWSHKRWKHSKEKLSPQ